MNSKARVKSVQFEMSNFIRSTKRPQSVVITPAAKSVEGWMKDVTASIQTSDNPQPLIDARQSLVQANEDLQRRDLTSFIASVKSAHDYLAFGNQEAPKEEVPYYKQRSIKSLLF